MRRQALTDERRVGVDDLTEEQLGAHGHDVTTHAQTTDMSEEARPVPSPRHPPEVLDGAVQGEEDGDHRHRFHNHLASSAVSGHRAKPTASCWASVCT